MSFDPCHQQASIYNRDIIHKAGDKKHMPQHKSLFVAALSLCVASLACGSLSNGGPATPTLPGIITLAPTETSSAQASAPVATTLAPVPTLAQTPDADGVYRQWAYHASASSEYGTSDWNALQAAGAPDTYPSCGDYPTAWASATSTGADSIVLEYALPVTPMEILIYETFNPGAIVRVTVIDPELIDSVVIYEGAPQINPPGGCPRIWSLSPDTDLQIAYIQIELDQRNHNGWNEIDAVELIGKP